MENFFNTIHLSGDELKKANADNKSQKQTVYEFFKSHPTGLFIYPEVHKGLKGEIIHEGSVQRSMSQLAKENKLVITKELVLGTKGKICHKYKLNDR